MAYVEEVFKNKGKWYGGNTGHLYEESETEVKGCCRWSKPFQHAPDAVILEIESGDQSEPEGNGCGKR